MTIGGVEALAAEVGIAPDVVRKAERSMRATPSGTDTPPRYNRLAGGPTTLQFERLVDGELREEDYPALVEEIRSVLNNVGNVSQFGRSFSWVAARRGGTLRELEVAVSIRDGRTRISVKEGLAPVLGGVYGGIGGGMGGGGIGPIIGVMAGALHLAGPAILVIIPAWLAVTYGTARAVFQRIASKRAKELKRLADRLAELTAELVPPRRQLLP